jgi:hypothetical protein
MQGTSKRQRPSGGTPEGGQAKRPKQTGQLDYARVAREGLRMAIVCEDYPKTQITKENFVDILHVIDRLVDELPEEGLTTRLVDSYWAKGAAISACHDEQTKHWLTTTAPTMGSWKGSRLKAVEMDALLAYKRVAAWFPCPVEDTERYFSRLCRLNGGLDTGNWRVYERREEPYGVHLVLSIDAASVTVLEGLNWRPFSGVRQAVSSLLGPKAEGRSRKKEEERPARHDKYHIFYTGQPAT